MRGRARRPCIGTLIRFATLVLTPWRRKVSNGLRMHEIWDIGAPTASRPAGWGYRRLRPCLITKEPYALVDNVVLEYAFIIYTHRAWPRLINRRALSFGRIGMREYGRTPNRQGVKLLVRRCPKSRASENICCVFYAKALGRE